MLRLWHKLQSKFRVSSTEMSSYKKDCEQLIRKYEQLLQHISEYMRRNRYVLQITPPSNAEDQDSLQLNSFSFLAIKDELLHITSECDALLTKGNERLLSFSSPNDSMKVLLSQLEELRNYSDQIEGALTEFEEKLLEMEEALAERSLQN